MSLSTQPAYSSSLLIVQGSGGTGGAGGAIMWAMILIVAALVGGLVILAVRKKMLETPSTDIGSEGLFDALKRMRESGEITREEYDAARKRILEKAMEGTARPETRSAAQVSILEVAAREEAEREARKREGSKRPAPHEDLIAPPGYDLTGEPLPGEPKERGPG